MPFSVWGSNHTLKALGGGQPYDPFPRSAVAPEIDLRQSNFVYCVN